MLKIGDTVKINNLTPRSSKAYKGDYIGTITTIKSVDENAEFFKYLLDDVGMIWADDELELQLTEYVRVRKDEYEEVHKRLFELANTILVLEKKLDKIKAVCVSAFHGDRIYDCKPAPKFDVLISNIDILEIIESESE